MSLKERAVKHANNESEVVLPNLEGRGRKVIEIKNAFILPGGWRNFRGQENKFGNSARTFNVVIPDVAVEPLLEIGFRVREVDVVNDIPEEGKMYVLNVKVKVDSDYPPLITLHTDFRGKRSRQTLVVESVPMVDEHGNKFVEHIDTVSELDRIDFERVDISINAYESPQFPGRVTAYLNKLSAIQIQEVDFDGIYDDWLEEDGFDNDGPF